jgi:GT2 family glycosyltransferase
MHVDAAVLHYRNWPDVRAVVDALRRQTFTPQRLTLIDNASNDGSVEAIREAFPDLNVREMPRNAGYAAAMNEFLRHGDADAFLLMTHDCRLADDALALLVDRLTEDATIGAAGPLLGEVDEPDRVFSAGVLLHGRELVVEHRDGGGVMANWIGRSAERVDALDGAAMLIRADAVRDVGFFDERYFLYFEETDYCVRLRRKGWNIECVPAARAWQRVGDFTQYFWVRNRLRFLMRNAPRRVFLRQLAGMCSWVVRSPHRERARGLVDFLRGYGGPAPNRAGPGA